MDEHLGKTAFVFVAIGTLGLLANEFLFAWGTLATLIFAAINIIGLAAVWVVLRRKRHDPTRR